MAKVSLRLYNREIESLIDHNQIDEAIAHCKFILQSYPKHLDTYRLLGNAYLEAEDYSAAADIFQRVLACLPDDFVSLVGMSIIREYENDLSSSIWYMERAFEIQPANNAVQEELRRLIERREGVKPLRIRMTRGALARMYAKGELYQQAIAEIHAILANDPERPDLQVLLARMCFLIGQKIEATEVCSDLLKKFPYCVEANRLLSQILPDTTRAEDVKIYLQRIYALDPYAAIKKDASSSTGTSDNAITLDRLDYKPGMPETPKQDVKWEEEENIVSGQSEKTSDAVSEWISNLEKTIPPAQEEKKPGTEAPSPVAATAETPDSTPVTPTVDIIPEWMKSAGWKEAQAENSEAAPADTDVVSSEPAPEPSESESDDLRSFFSSNLENDQAKQPAEEAQLTPSDEIPDWLKSLEPEETVPVQSDQNQPVESLADTTFISDEDLPDWLRDLKQANTQDAESIKEPEPSQPEPEEPKPAVPIEAVEAAPSEEIPDWLKDFSYDDEKAAEVNNQTPAAIEPVSPLINENAVAQGVGEDIEIPDWLKDLGKQPITQTEAASESSTFISEIPQESLQVEKPAVESPAETETPLETTQPSITAELEPTEKGGKFEAPIETTQPLIAAELETSEKVEEPAIEKVPELIPSAKPENELPIWLQNIEDSTQTQTNKPTEAPYTWVPEITDNKAGVQPSVLEEAVPEILSIEPVSQIEPESAQTAEAAPENQPETTSPVMSISEEPSVSSTTFESQEISIPGEPLGGSEAIEPVQSAIAQENVPLTEEIPISSVPTEETPDVVEIPSTPLPSDSVFLPTQKEEPAVQPVSMQAESEQALPVESNAVEPEHQETPVEPQEPAKSTFEEIASPTPETTENQPVVEEPVQPDEWTALFQASHTALTDGDIDNALNGYAQLLKQQLFLNDIAQDLESASTRFPDNISLLLTLGDTYTRLNRLQEALNIYTKAEEIM